MYTVDSRGWLKDCRQCVSPNQDERPADTDVELVVVHAISLPPGIFGGMFIEELFLNQLDVSSHPYFARLDGLRVSAHLLIDRKGELTQFVSFDARAWHAGESTWHGRNACNDFAIGIELEGCDEKPFEPAQYEQLVQVMAALIARYPKLDAATVCGHSDIAPHRKTDPGPLFDWQRFSDLLGSCTSTRMSR